MSDDDFNKTSVPEIRLIEPSADLRKAAKDLRQMFIALVNEDFSEKQALAIIGHILAAGSQNGGGA